MLEFVPIPVCSSRGIQCRFVEAMRGRAGSFYLEKKSMYSREEFGVFLFLLFHVTYGPESFTNDKWSLIPFICISVPDSSAPAVPLDTIISTPSLLTHYLPSFSFPRISIFSRPVSAVIWRTNVSFAERYWSPPWMFSDQIPGSRTVRWKDRIPYFSRYHISANGLKMERRKIYHSYKNSY